MLRGEEGKWRSFLGVGWLAGGEMEMDAESEEVDGLNEETASALRQN